MNTETKMYENTTNSKTEYQTHLEVTEFQSTFVNTTTSTFMIHLSNKTNLDLDGYESLNEKFDIIYGALSFIITPFVVVGNLLVIISLFKFKRLQTTTNMFIGSLAMSDFLLGLITLPMYALFYLDKALNGEKYLCLVRYTSVILSMSSSLVNLVVIAVDRYIAILHPLRYPILMTKRRAKVVIAFVWMYHCIICSLPILGWNNYDKFNGTVCDFFIVLPQPYTMFTTPITILIGLCISLILYSQIYKVAKEQKRKMIARKEWLANRQFTKDARSARAMGIILFFFFIFWVPFMLGGPLKYLKIAKNLLNIIKNFSLTLAMSNSAVNPFMYCWLRKEFKCAFQELFRNYLCSKIPQPDWSSSVNSIEEKESNLSDSAKSQNDTEMKGFSSRTEIKSSAYRIAVDGMAKNQTGGKDNSCFVQDSNISS